jgi:hypothetical protein
MPVSLCNRYTILLYLAVEKTYEKLKVNQADFIAEVRTKYNHASVTSCNISLLELQMAARIIVAIENPQVLKAFMDHKDYVRVIHEIAKPHLSFSYTGCHCSEVRKDKNKTYQLCQTVINNTFLIVCEHVHRQAATITLAVLVYINLLT